MICWPLSNLVAFYFLSNLNFMSFKKISRLIIDICAVLFQIMIDGNLTSFKSQFDIFKLLFFIYIYIHFKFVLSLK